MRRKANAARFRRSAPTALALLWLAQPPPAAAAHWTVAPPAPCAEAPAPDRCRGRDCAAPAVPVRGRFDPTDVAVGPSPAPNPLPNAPKFTGPGPCVELGNGCGRTVPSPVDRVAAPSRPVLEPPPVFAPPP